METILYLLCRLLLALTAVVPLRLVAWIGRRGGGLAWLLDKRHRNMALENLAAAFPEKSEREIRQLAKVHFQRLGETYACILKTSSMDADEIRRVLSMDSFEEIEQWMADNPDGKIILAIGHFGQFELFLWLKLAVPSAKNWITTYRGLRQEKLNKLLGQLRGKSGAQLFDRRTEAAELKQALNEPSTVLGLLADQHGGINGLRMPVMGREASVNPAPAVMAKRYRCRLFAAACFRIAPGKWRLELAPEIILHENDKLRDTTAITADLVAAQDEFIRADPANWFWVHNRWKDVRTAAEREG